MKIIPAVITALTAWSVAACTPAHPDTSTKPPPTVAAPSGTEGDDGAGDLAGHPEWSITCGEDGVLLEVEPDTPETREAAKKRCARDDEAINDAPWPSGWHPTTLPTGR